MFRASIVSKWLVAGLFTASLSVTQWAHAADVPMLVIEPDDKPQSLAMQSASIRFFGDPCTCSDRGASGRMTLHFSVDEGSKPSAFVAQVIGSVAPEASQGNPGIRVYMPDSSVWVAKRLGHTAVTDQAGDPGIKISGYECKGDAAEVTLTIDGELVFTPSVLAASIGPYDSPKRAAVSLKETSLTLQRSLLKSESCP